MSGLESVAVDAGADLSGSASQYKAVSVSGVIAANNTASLGILQNKPRSGEDATVGIAGRSRYVAGAAVTLGDRLMVTTSGFIIEANTVSFGIGTALGAVSSGGIGAGYFNFAGAKSQITSSHLE